MISKSRKVISVDTLLDGGIRPWTEICHSILLRLHRIFLQIRWTRSNGEFCERLEFPSAKTSVKQTCADKCVCRFLVLVDVSQKITQVWSTKKNWKGYTEKHKIIVLESSQSNRLVELYILYSCRNGEIVKIKKSVLLQPFVFSSSYILSTFPFNQHKAKF